LAAAGAAMVEIGIPFSDPLADGPTIQESSGIALKNGVTIDGIFRSVKEIRASTEIPVILMGYINPILKYGTERFLAAARDSGVDGLIVPDMPPEESEDLRTSSSQNGISNIFLIAPTSSDDRIRTLDGLSTDFTYCVSVTGVTGARSSFGEHFDEFLQRVKHNTSKPFVVGFGIKRKEQVRRIAHTADGAVVGSALLNAMKNADTASGAADAAAAFLTTLN
jgi:tryptophan synthase alpha chain